MQVLSRVAAILLAVVSLSSYALGLGDIELRSYLNQPLHAVVPLHDVDASDIANVRARVGSVEQYDRAGLLRDDYVRTISVEVVDSPAGPAVRLRGEGPLQEPFIDLLVEVRHGRSQLQRQYTVLLDPPGADTPPPMAATPPPAEAAPARPEPVAEAPDPPPVETAQAPASPARQPVVATAPMPIREAPPPREPTPEPVAEPEAAPAPAPPPRSVRRDAGDDFFTAPQERRLDPELLRAIRQPAARQASATASPTPTRQAENDVYTVARGETLWRVAHNTRPDARVTMDQMMLAIAAHNPDAFADGNAQALLRGARLQIPAREQVTTVDPDTATQRMAELTTGRLRTTALADYARPRPTGEAADPAREAVAEDETPADPPDDPSPDRGDAELLAAELLAEAEQSPEAVAEIEGEPLQDEVAEVEVISRESAVADAATRDDEDIEDEAAVAVAPGTPPAAQVAISGAEPSQPTSGWAVPTSIASAQESLRGIDWRMALLGVGALLLVLAALLAVRRRRKEGREVDVRESDGPRFAHDPVPAAATAVAVGATEDDLARPGDDEGFAEAGRDDAFAATSAQGEFDDREVSLEGLGDDLPQDDGISADTADDDQRDNTLAGVAFAAGAGAVAAGAAASDESKQAPPGELDRDEVLSDADFRISFGMLDDAESRLKAALQEYPDDPDLHAKLAEVYAAGQREPEFREAAAKARQTGVEGAQLATLTQLEDSFGAAGDRPAAGGSEAPAVTAGPESGGDDNLLDFDLDGDWSLDTASEAAMGDDELDLGAVSSGDAETVTVPGAADADELLPDDEALELELKDFDTGTAAEDGSGATAVAEDTDTAGDADGELQLEDFDLAAEEASPEGDMPLEDVDATSVQHEASGEDISLEEFSLGDEAAEGGQEDAGAGLSADTGSVVSARLDLARTYADMGDADLARPMLEEILEQGDEAQREEARRLIDELG